MSEDNLENFDQIATGVADAIHDGYVKYITSFQEITRRAGNHFANQEWSSQDQEAVQQNETQGPMEAQKTSNRSMRSTVKRRKLKKK